MIEELDVKVKVGRLLWIVENFYSGEDFITKEPKICHELGFYFLMEMPKASRLRKMETIISEDGGFEIFFKWFPLETLGRTRLLPSFLQKELRNIPASTKHIIHGDKTED